MAFALGFDKSKILQAAEKYVVQGKIQAAIDEYNKILKKDPKDLMTLNTVGDLYVRVGKNDEALKCFFDLAEKSVEAGLLPRAIAIYKRITKIDPESAPALLKLGELYSMQGLLRDARIHYLQAVEILLKRREKEKAREVFEKVLLLDMENPRLLFQMAELYADTGKKPEALATFLAAAERFLDTNDPAEAGKALDAMLRLDPGNTDARTLMGRLYLEQGEHDKAVATLETIPSVSGNKGALNVLFQTYRKQGNGPKAQETASQLFLLHEDFAALEQIAGEFLAQGNVGGAWEIFQGAADRLMAQQCYSILVEGLRKILSSDRSHLGAWELMWATQQKGGSPGEAKEALEQLANAYVVHEELDKARELYSKLVALEPENPEHRRLLRQVQSRLGTAEEELPPAFPALQETATAGVPSVGSVEALPPREQALVSTCLTESDLYKTYHQVSRAIETLENGLAQVPGNITLYEHLLPLFEQTEQYEKAAACAEALTEAYIRIGDGERASQYGELTGNLQQKALEAPSPAVETAVPEELAQELPGISAPDLPAPEEPQVREVDLSMEWASLPGGEESAPAAAGPESAVEEIEFYLQAGLASDAAAALDRLQEQSPLHPALGEFRDRLAVLQGGVSPAEMPASAPSTSPEFPAPPTEAAELDAAGAPSAPTEIPWGEAESSEAVPEGIPSEAGLGDSGMESAILLSPAEPEVLSPPEPEPDVFSPAPTEAEPEALSPPAAEAPHELVLDEIVPSAERSQADSSFELFLEETHPAETAVPGPPANPLAALAGELEETVDLPETAAPVASAATPTKEEAAATPREQSQEGLLDDLFAEFKEEMEEPAASEDIETHYNMGIAFKEMALYDEAIGEFQKVHHLAERAKDYSYLVRCCSLLANCFLEKGLPQLAVNWYQTALHSPGLPPESSLALLYEVGSAYEMAGDRQAALRSFLEVYARNIDYRNVAERIRDLQQNP